MTVGEAIQRQEEFIANKYHIFRYNNKDLKESMKVLTKAYSDLWKFLENNHKNVLNKFILAKVEEEAK